MTKEKAMAAMAEYLGWPVESVPEPSQIAGGWAWDDPIVLKRYAYLFNGGTPHAWDRLALEAMARHQGKPTPAEMAEGLRKRVAYLEEAVRVRDEAAVDEYCASLSTGEMAETCRYCGMHLGRDANDCPSITHPLGAKP